MHIFVYNVCHMHYIAALGNPGEEYAQTRHNVGRIVLAPFLERYGFPTPVPASRYVSLVSEGVVDGEAIMVLMPETYMNKSGSAVGKVVTSAPKARRLIVLYDDIDLPLGIVRVSFGRGAGGHRGVDSIIKTLKTRDFVRVRVGIMPTTPSGKPKKPKGEQSVLDFLMSDFTKKEQAVLEKTAATVADALAVIVTEGHVAAMNRFN